MEGLKKILVPVDFSHCSNNAIRYGLEMARDLNAELTLVHAFQYPFAFPEAQLINPQDGLKMVEESVEEAFEELKKKIPLIKELGVKLIKVPASAIEAISDLTKSSDYDLVIMGTKGAAGLEGQLLGSITSHVIKEVKCPLLAIPQEAKYQALDSIAFLFDFAELDEAPELNMLRDLSRAYSSMIHILHIKGKYPQKHFDNMAFLDNYFSHQKHAMSSSLFEHFEGGVNDFSEQNNIKALAILVRKKNLLEQLFTRSHSKDLALHTHLPLLAIHE